MEGRVGPLVDSEGNLADEDVLRREARWSLVLGVLSLGCFLLGPFAVYLGGRTLDYHEAGTFEDRACVDQARTGRFLGSLGTLLLIASVIAALIYVSKFSTVGVSAKY